MFSASTSLKRHRVDLENHAWFPIYGMNDVFRPIDGFPGYRVSSSGEVQSCWVRRGRIATLSNCWRSLTPIERLGYKTINLTRGGGNKTALRIHRLVLEAFVGPCPEGLICLHGDGDPTNNSLENLRFDSPKANSDDKIRHGTMIRGEAARHARLREEEVLTIRRLRSGGARTADLAVQFGVSQRNVRAIVQGRTWRHLLPHGEASPIDHQAMSSRGAAA